MIKRIPKRLRRPKTSKYQKTENNTFFSEKEFIIRANGRTKVFKISSRIQWFIFLSLIAFALWGTYSYQLYSISDRIISYQERKLYETRDAYVDLMSVFVTVHNNISGMVENISVSENNHIDEYLKKAQVIEDKIRQITANEDWINEENLDNKNALREALIKKDIAIEEKKLLEEKVKHLEEMIKSLQDIEVELLKKVETISNKEIDSMKSSISTINKEIKKRGKYFNPLANSKKDNKGGVYIPDNIALATNQTINLQTTKTFNSLDDNNYYKEILKKIPLGKPVWSYWLSSPFGKRKDPFNAKSARHKGVDLASNTGNKIKTMADGKVTKSGTGSGYGKVVEIDHGNGFKTKYAHMNAIYVKKGDFVTQGQAIGEVGNTGRSTGPHLHYEILYEGAHLDPMVFIKASQ